MLRDMTVVVFVVVASLQSCHGDDSSEIPDLLSVSKTQQEIPSDLELYSASLYSLKNFYRKVGEKLVSNSTTDYKNGLVVFPFGFYEIFAVLFNGARSTTKQQLGGIISDRNLSDLAVMDERLLQALFNDDETSIVQVNSLVKSDIQLKNQFKAVLNDYYKTSFVQSPHIDKSSENPNKTHEDAHRRKTKTGKISIINLASFKIKWTPLLKQRFPCGTLYPNSDDIVWKVVPFEDPLYKFLVVWPVKTWLFNKVEREIEEMGYENLVRDAEEYYWEWTPKFNYTSYIYLDNPLNKLGVNGSDFSGVSSEKISVNSLSQSAFLKFDKTGVKISVTTGINLVKEKTNSSLYQPPDVLFYIVKGDYFILKGRFSVTKTQSGTKDAFSLFKKRTKAAVSSNQNRA